MNIDLLALVSGIMLLEYFVFMAAVGAARGKAGIDAPAMSGDDLFERTLRVQENTLEQLIYVLPSMWLFGYYISSVWAAGLGAAFILGRIIYFIGYRAAPGKRATGFLIGWAAAMVMLIGGLWGALRTFL